MVETLVQEFPPFVLLNSPELTPPANIIDASRVSKAILRVLPPRLLGPLGLIDIFAKVGAKLGEKSSLTLFAHNFTAQAEIAEDVKKGLGTELDLVYTHKFSKDIAIGAGYSQMFASEGLEYLKNNFDGNSNNWAWLMLTIKPTLFTSKK